MEIISSLVLLMGILIAFTCMIGGNPSSILRPGIRMVEGLLMLAIRMAMMALGTIFKLGAGSINLPKSLNSRENKPAGPPPTRW